MECVLLKQLAILLLCHLPVAFNQESQESCMLFFTTQPPPSIPCNPYKMILNPSTRLTLQCTVHAPKLDLNLMEMNHTIEWVRQGSEPGDVEEILSTVSENTGFEVQNDRVTYIYSQSSAMAGTYVKSTLSIDLASVPSRSLPGRYWCQVLVKTLSNYSYRYTGRSNSETVILDSNLYSSSTNLTLLPPCVASEGPLYQPYFRCVSDSDLVSPFVDGSSTRPVPQGDSISISSGVLAAVAVAGGALIVIVLILLLVVIYACKIVNERKIRGVQSSPASTHSGEKQEIGADTHQPAVSSHLVQPHPLNNSGYQQSSLGRRNESYRKTHKNRMPHYSPERQLMESFSTDTSGYNNKMKSTGSNSNMA